MKVLVDAQLPPALAVWLRNGGFEADHLADLGMSSATDQVVWNYALAGGYILLSKDHDFVEWAVTRTPAPQVVWLRTGNRKTKVLLSWLETRWPQIVEMLLDGSRIVEAGR